MRKVTFIKRFLLLLLLSIVGSGVSWAQVNISAGNTVTQDFSIGTTATATLPTGWKADKNTTVRLVGSYSTAATATSVAGGNTLSSTAGNGIYNFGAGVSGTATDRAVGGLSSSSASKSVNVYVQLTNNGAGSISSFTISYAVEKYRNGSNSAGFSIQMYYSTDGTTWTSAGSDFLTSYVADADNNGYASAPGTTTNVSSKTLSQALAAGNSLYLAWNYSVTSGTTTSNAQALGIDDVSITAVSSTPISVPVVSDASPSGTVGLPFSYQIQATNFPISYAIASGTLPAGLNLNTATGEISGTPTAAGTPSVTVTATNAGGTSTAATLNFTISAPTGLAQTITFGVLSAKTYGDASFDLAATASSGLTVSYASSNTNVATISGSTVTIVGAGSTDITATQAGDATYNPATAVVQSLTVAALPLTIANAAVTTKAYNGTNAAVITGTLTGVINSDDVSLVGAGLFADVNVGTAIAVTSNSSLSGTKATNYTLTQPTGLTGEITKASQTITFGALSTKTVSDVKFKLSGTASSGLALSYTSSNSSVATVVNDSVSIVGVGTTTITASQAGNGNYNAATDVAQTLTVTGAPIIAWQFGSPASLGSETTYNATTNNDNLNTSVLSRGAGITSTALGRGFSANAWDNGGTKATAETNGEYYEFTVNAKAGYKVSISSIDATVRRSGASAPNTYIWKYSLDGTTFTEIGTEVSYTGTTEGIAQPQLDLSGITALQNIESANTITFRLYAWGGTSTTSTFAIGRYGTNITTNSLAISGTVDVATGIQPVNKSVTVIGRTIVVNPGTECAVFNLQGVRVAYLGKSSGMSTISVMPGAYIVKMDSVSQKIIVK